MSDLRETEYPARFQFPVSWSTLVDADALVSDDKALVVAPRKAAFDSNLQWAMVIPRLSPPAPTALLLPARPDGEAPQFAAPRYLAPKFEVSTESASIAVKLVLIAAVIMLLIPGWRNTGSPGARAVEIESTMSERSWIRASGLVLYRPSIDQTDYRIEFTWRVVPNGLAWAFRAKDNNNYYAFRIKPKGPGSSKRLSVERFVLYQGVERSRVVKALTLAKDDPDIRVRMDVTGSAFKLYLGGNVVSQWTDSRLSSGGIGFLEEANHHAEIHSLRVSFTP